VGDLVYVGSCSGILFALDRTTGRPRWTHDVRPQGRHTSFHGDPLVIDSMLVIGTDGGDADSTFGEIFAFDLASGRVLWKRSTTDGIVSDMCRMGDRLLAVTRADSLLCLDAATGRLVWSYRGDGPLYEIAYRSPAVAGDRVFFPGSDGTVHALDAGSGRLLWKRDLRDRITTGILALGDELFLGASGVQVYRLRQRTGAIEARLNLDGPTLGPPTLVGDSLIVLAGDRSLTCVGRSLTGIRWLQPLPDRLSSSRPYLWRDTILAGTVNGELLGLSASHGLPRWSHPLKGVIRGIGTSDRVLYVGTQEGTVHAYSRPAPPLGRR
jgi:outer membrane protein assembly factor BamB